MLFDFISLIFKTLNQKLIIKYHLYSIDMAKGKATFFLKNKSKPLIIKFVTLLNDMDIILGMNAIEACYLGGYYGRYVYGIKNSNIQKNIAPIFSKRSLDTNRFHLISTNRLGEVKYFDKRKKTYYIELPYNIVKCRYKIENFNSSQSFYLGLLASTYICDCKSINKKPKNIPLFLLVS